MSIGDLIFQMMGKPDPRLELARALAPAGAAPGGPPAGGVGTPAPAMGAPGPVVARDPANQPLVTDAVGMAQEGKPAPAPPPPKQPDAYTSPPDLISLYTKLAERQRADRAIDNGAGLLFSAFSRPENRANIINAMNQQDQGPDAGSQLENLMKLQTGVQSLQDRSTVRSQLPAIAQKYGISLEAANALFQTGGLDNFLVKQTQPEISSNIKDYNFYVMDEKKAGRNPLSFDEWTRIATKSRAKYGLQPVYTTDTDKDGNMVVKSWQTSDAGGPMQPLQDEHGNQVQSKPLKVETPTEIQILNPYTREVLKTIPKDVKGAAESEAMGKSQADLSLKLPGVDTTLRGGLKTIDEVLQDKGLSKATGFSSYLFPMIPGSDAARVQSKLDSLQGKSFLQAYETLRGGGAISDIEGAKATEALSRLKDQKLSEPDYRDALMELKSIMRTGLANAYAKAGKQIPTDLAGDATTPAVSVDASQPTAPKVRKYNMDTGKFE